MAKINLKPVIFRLGKKQNLNQVFEQLSAQGVQVLSMRNKSNRLEALFINLINKQQVPEGSAKKVTA